MISFSWNWKFFEDLMPSLLSGLQTTIIATLLGTALAMILGLVFILIRLARIPVLSLLVTWFSCLLRGTPLLIQLYFLFFILPTFGIVMPPLTTGIVGLGLNYAVQASEIYRAGIENIPRGQWEAAHSLSLPIPWMWRQIILPQAIRPVIPMLGNLLVVMFKDSALLSAIAITELVSAASQVAQDNYRFIEPYTAAGLIFFVVSYISILGIRKLERWSVKRD
jgi:polar amino acid transport system permease protein